MMKLQFVLILAFAATCFVESIDADSIVFDDFDDGQLDPRWQVSFTYADGWTYWESGTHLTVTDIDSTIVNTESGGVWGTVQLSQSFPSVTDFQFTVDFSWDAEGRDEAMQHLVIRVLDQLGNIIASVYYRDSWVGARGGISATAGSSSFDTGHDQLPYAGSATVQIKRKGNDIDVFWNEANILSDIDGTPVSAIDLSFEHNAFDSYDTSFFGSISVDKVVFDGTFSATPACPLISMTYNVECSDSVDWVRVSGEVESYDGEPLCAMVLANGQHMFTCDLHLGHYDLIVPVDENGRVTVFGFVDGYQPSRKILTAPMCSP